MNLDLGEKPVFTATWLGEGDGLTNEVVLCVCVCVCVCLFVGCCLATKSLNLNNMK